MTKIATFNLLAGGTGKTAGVKTYAEWLAKQGFKTAILDFDHQRSLSEAYDNYEDDPDKTTLAMFQGKDVDFIPVLPNLWLVPAHAGLGELVAELRARGTQNVYFIFDAWLDKHADELTDKFDYILIDTHPDDQTVTLNAIAVSHTIVGLVEPDEKSNNGVIKTEFAIEKLKEDTVQIIRMEDGTKKKITPVNCELILIANNIKRSANNQTYEKLSKDLLDVAFDNPNYGNQYYGNLKKGDKADSRYVGIVPSSDFIQHSLSGDKEPIWTALEDEKKLKSSDVHDKKMLEQTMRAIKNSLDNK